jgi:periplasmic protein CpxP/Spy
MKKNGLKYLVMIALLINAATLIFFWLHRPPPQGDRPPPRGKMQQDKLIESLNFDENQQKTFEILRGQHRQAMDSFSREIAENRKILYEKMPLNDAKTADSLMVRIGYAQQKIEAVTFQHFTEVRKICRPEQQQKLDKMLLEVASIVSKPKGEKPPPN